MKYVPSERPYRRGEVYVQRGLALSIVCNNQTDELSLRLCG